MKEIDDIKANVVQLPSEQEGELRGWLIERHHRAWDQKIVQDLAAGNLDDVILEATMDHAREPTNRHGRGDKSPRS